MHYAQIYVNHPDQLRELDEMGIHWDPTPLFPSEWPSDVEDTALTMCFNGDPEDTGGQFVFALLPAQVYNAIRAEALAGEDTYKAVIVRSVPSEARGPNNTVSWDYLAQNLTSYAAPHGELTDDGEIVPPLLEEESTATSQKRLGRRLRRFARKIATAVRGIVEGVRIVVGKLTNLVTKDRTLRIKTHVKERNGMAMTRAWDAQGYPFGQELYLKDMKINVSGLTRLTQYGGRLNNVGEITVTVPSSLNVQVCLEADSKAVKMESGILFPVLHCWKRFRPTTSHPRSSAPWAIMNFMPWRSSSTLATTPGRSWNSRRQS